MRHYRHYKKYISTVFQKHLKQMFLQRQIMLYLEAAASTVLAIYIAICSISNSCSLIASLHHNYLFSFSPGWKHDEIHAAVWERDVGQEGDDGEKSKREGVVLVRVCGWIFAIHPVSPPLPIASRCGLDTARIPTKTLIKGSDWNAFSPPLELHHAVQSDRCYRLGCKHIALSPVLKIALLKIKMLLHYKAAPDQQRATVLPVELIFVFLSFFCQNRFACKKFWFISNYLLWEFGHKNFCIYLMHLGWQIWHISNDVCWFYCYSDPVLLYWPGCRLLAEFVWCLLLEFV